MASSALHFPYPSTLNPTSFVSVKLSGHEKYTLWEAQMLCLIESQQLVGFIDGTLPPPPEALTPVVNGGGEMTVVTAANGEYQMWKRSDWLVKGWILGSLDECVLSRVVGLSTAKAVWTMLRSTFGPDSQEKGATSALAARRGKTCKDYPYPSMLNVANFVSFKLRRTNYSMWIRQILSLIESQDLNFLIYLPAPSEVSSDTNDDNLIDGNKEEVLQELEDYNLWKRSDQLLKGWILGSLSEDVLPLVAYLATSRDVLLKLEETFLTNVEHCVFPRKLKTPRKGEELVEDEKAEEIQFIDYPYPSTLNVENFVSVKLTRNNHHLWSMQITSLIESQGLLGFITNPAPSQVFRPHNEDIAKWELQNQDYMLWRRTDLLLRGWILGTISEDVLQSLVEAEEGLDTSKNVMVAVKETLVQETEDDFHSQEQTEDSTTGDDAHYNQLYKAALEGDWETAKAILTKDTKAATAIISTTTGQTVLHVAVGTGTAIPFVRNLVDHLPIDAIMVRQKPSGNTALSIAALVGNTEAAKILTLKNPALLSIGNDEGNLPFHLALHSGNRETLMYLLTAVNPGDEIYSKENAAALSSLTIAEEFFDIALDLVKRYPHAAVLEPENFMPDNPDEGIEPGKFMPALSVVAGKDSCFRSGMRLNSLESFIYSYVPVKFDNISDGSNGGYTDIENPASNSDLVHSLGVLEKWYITLWDVLQPLVPPIMKIHQKKTVHHQAVQLVKYLCEAIKDSFHESLHSRYISEPVTKAATLGIFEVVEGIVDILPEAIWCRNEKRHYITQIAVINRCERVFCLLYNMSRHQRYITTLRDDSGNNILHFAAQLAPLRKLNHVSGAALQMQRELQWFQEIEKLVHPNFKQMENSSGETPTMVFTREHAKLVRAGEQWMKDTANSCTIAAALIITIVFAAAITVPGGNNQDTGLPIFSKGRAFSLFAISDAISLFTATTSLLMFLSILTARYGERDFLYALPSRLVFGLLTLFLSITSMIIAFSTTVYLVFGDKKGWIIIPLVALSGLPVTSFVTLQFPLLMDVIASTFFRGTFGDRSNRPFY